MEEATFNGMIVNFTSDFTVEYSIFPRVKSFLVNEYYASSELGGAISNIPKEQCKYPIVAVVPMTISKVELENVPRSLYAISIRVVKNKSMTLLMHNNLIGDAETIRWIIENVNTRKGFKVRAFRLKEKTYKFLSMKIDMDLRLPTNSDKIKELQKVEIS